jgi:hypothetical protein
VAEAAQCGGELLIALRHPQQRPHRRAQCGRLDDATQIVEQRGIRAPERVTATTFAADLAWRQRRLIQFVEPVPNGRERKRGDRGNRRLAAPSRRARLTGGKQPLATLVKLRANQFPAQQNPLSIDHPQAHTTDPRCWESHRSEPHQRSAPATKSIHLFRRLS